MEGKKCRSYAAVAAVQNIGEQVTGEESEWYKKEICRDRSDAEPRSSGGQKRVCQDRGYTERTSDKGRVNPGRNTKNADRVKGRNGEKLTGDAGRWRKRSGRFRVHVREPTSETIRPDYTVYRFSSQERVRYFGQFLLLDASVSILFFNSVFVFFCLCPFAAVYIREQKQMLLRRRADEMLRQFLDGLSMTAASLQAGYSVENAFREAVKELKKLHGRNSFVVREFELLGAQLDVSRSVEELLLDLGRRSGVEDIQSFAEVFLTAKRSGGDLLAVIRNTVSCIRQKQETMQEIETCLAGKVMEQNIMSLVPILILAYVRLTSPEFLIGMYDSTAGTAVMTVCFLVYAAAYFWGKRIVRIEV